jgi:23S rRNA pseudouridine2457 synthase
MTTIIFNKPFDVITRFTAPDNAKEGQLTLAGFIDDATVWPIGRLDRDSEGLLVLSNDVRIRTRLLDPAFAHPRTYLVQVEGEVSTQTIEALTNGIVIEGKRTLPADAVAADEPSTLWPRNPPIRHRASIPTAWLQLTLTEGRNRQVRKMTAAVGLPCLRLIRQSILHLDIFELGLQPGQHRTLESAEVTRLEKALHARH